MSTPESPKSQFGVSVNLKELQLELDEINRQLELVDANENQIERTSQLETLSERKDWLEGKIDQYTL